MLTAVVCSGRNRPQERPVGCDAERPPLVGGRDEPEQKLCSGVVQGREPELVDDDELVAQQVLDDLPDRVVGKPSVEGLDQLGGGEVSDPATGLDRGDP